MKSKPSTRGKTPLSKKETTLDKPKSGHAMALIKSVTNWFSFLFKPYNLLFCSIAIALLMLFYSFFPTYNWLYKNLLRDGDHYCAVVQKEIDRRTRSVRNPVLKRIIAYDTKYEAKIGVDYMLLKLIRDNTPPNAIILFPPPLILTQKTSYLTLRYDFTLKPWVSHFLYPRTVVYEQEKGKNPFYEKAQYILLLHGWGYDHLDYKPKRQNPIDFLPLHQSTSR